MTIEEDENRRNAENNESDELDEGAYYLSRKSSKSFQRLRIERKDGSSFALFYDEIHTIELAADGRQLGLCIRGGLLITLVGERLNLLADHLDESRIRRISIYDAQRHLLKEPEKPSPLIHDIIEQDLATKKKLF
jgi:hypothetical protein